VPIEQLGVAIADGNGAQACSMALSLASLGFDTAIYRDSDTALSAENIAALNAMAIPVFEYGGGLNTENAVFSAASDPSVQELLVYARAEKGSDAIDNNLDLKIPDLGIAFIRDDFASWVLFTELDGSQLRQAVSEVADRKKWFKDQRIGRGLAPMVGRIVAAAPASPLAQTLAEVEAWLYA
jgi:hypothetical protein